MAFELCFVAMGLGDCTIIKCPNDEMVIVDCGLSKKDIYGVAVNGIAQGKTWLWQKLANNNSTTVHSVIFTHPDQDHYNQLDDFLTDTVTNNNAVVSLSVARLFFSSATKASKLKLTPLSRYKSNSIAYNFSTGAYNTTEFYEPEIYSATIVTNEVNQWDASTINQKNNGGKKTATSGNYLHNVISGVHLATAWSIDIICGNVGEHTMQQLSLAEQMNANSLIVLLTFGNKKVLLMGDAHSITQDFLVAQHQATVASVDLITAPHHGSSHNVNMNFINNFNTQGIQYIAVSTKKAETKHHMPAGLNGVQHLIGKLTNNQNLPGHTLEFWEPITNNTLATIYSNWAFEELNGRAQLTPFPRRDGYFSTPLDINNIWAIHELQKTAFKLVRQQSQRHVFQTSQATVMCTLDGNGISVTSNLP